MFIIEIFKYYVFSIIFCNNYKYKLIVYISNKNISIGNSCNITNCFVCITLIYIILVKFVLLIKNEIYN